MNNPNVEESVGQFLMHDNVSYWVIGREVGESGTPHLQGYMVLKIKKDLVWMKKNIHKGAHWEVARGTPQEASDYCKKDGDFLESGELPESQCTAGGVATKKRWRDAFDYAQKGEFEKIDPQILIQCHRTLKRIHLDTLLERPMIEGELENLWYYGPPGSGKSRRAREEYPDLFLKALSRVARQVTEYVICFAKDKKALGKEGLFGSEPGADVANPFHHRPNKPRLITFPKCVIKTSMGDG